MKEREAQRRSQIIQAVRDVVSDVGLEGATMRLIAKRAGISTGMLTYYYANKREMILAALDASSARRSGLSREIGGRESNPKRVAAYFDAAFPEDDDQVDPWAFTIEYWAAATRDADLRERHLRLYWRGREALAGHIRAGMEAGIVRSDLDPYDLAELFMALRKGIGIELAFREQRLSVKHARELTQVMLDLVRSPSQARSDGVASVAGAVD